MSLLLDALKRAEEGAKRAKPALDGQTDQTSLPAEPAAEAEVDAEAMFDTTQDIVLSMALPPPPLRQPPPPVEPIIEGAFGASAFEAMANEPTNPHRVRDVRDVHAQAASGARVPVRDSLLSAPKPAGSQPLSLEGENPDRLPASQPALAEEPPSTSSLEMAAESSRRATAQNVFGVKQATGMRKRSQWGLLLLLVLGGGLAGGGWYVWNEVNRFKPSMLANRTANPIIASNNTPRAPDATAPAGVANSPVATVTDALPPLLPPEATMMAMPTTATGAPLRVRRVALATTAVPANLTERESLAAEFKNLPRSAGAPPKFTVSTNNGQPRVSPSLTAAYAALTAGDYTKAIQTYSQFIETSPANIDAYLGLATAAARLGDNDLAKRAYRRALELDPRNIMAASGMLALATPDEVASASAPLEAALQNMVAKQPLAANTHYALGNFYASERRWSEAQQAYFEASRLEPTNPDYAYNLAVSLDHLGQAKLAIDHYRRALAAPAKSQFDRASVERRISELGATTKDPKGSG